MPSIPIRSKKQRKLYGGLVNVGRSPCLEHMYEEQFINHVAVRLGLNELDVRQFDQHPENLTLIFPKINKVA